MTTTNDPNETTDVSRASLTLGSPEERWMLRCLELARKGSGSVSPNPMVGAVVVRDGRIIGEGYHQTYGEAHAEVNAIRNAGGEEQVRGATVVVNLEPCNYTGKTPPCTELLIRSGISRVVFGMTDPNPRVSGRGMAQLEAAGISVTAGVLQKECRKLNRAFVKHIRTGLPYVTLKAAQTIDGKISREWGSTTRITGKEARIRSHAMRAETDAILVGANTVFTDDPELTVREVEGRNPARVILTRRLDLALNARVFFHADRERVFLFTGDPVPEERRRVVEMLEKRNVAVHALPVRSDGTLPLVEVLRILGRSGIMTLMVEGGAATYAAFLSQRVVDAVAIFIAPKIFGRGLDAFYDVDLGKPGSYLHLQDSAVTRVGEDILLEGEL